MGRALNTVCHLTEENFFVKIFRLIDKVGKKQNVKKGRKKMT
jgi:hypothetical protein